MQIVICLTCLVLLMRKNKKKKLNCCGLKNFKMSSAEILPSMQSFNAFVIFQLSRLKEQTSQSEVSDYRPENRTTTSKGR